MWGKFLVGALLAALAALIMLMKFTTPGQAGPLGVLAVFGLLYVSVLCVLTFLIVFINKFCVKYASALLLRKPVLLISKTKAYYFASVLALGPVMLIGMQSVGGVGVYELCLIILFLTTSCIYVAKRVH